VLSSRTHFQVRLPGVSFLCHKELRSSTFGLDLLKGQLEIVTLRMNRRIISLRLSGKLRVLKKRNIPEIATKSFYGMLSGVDCFFSSLWDLLHAVFYS
jgi:hypothetical protein